MMVKLKMANKIIVRVGIAIVLVIIVAIVAKKYGNNHPVTVPANEPPHMSSAPAPVQHITPPAHVVPAPAHVEPAPMPAPAKPK